MTTKTSGQSAPVDRPCSTVYGSQWSLQTGIDVSIHPSDMDGTDVAIQFIDHGSHFVVDLKIDDVLRIRDELTRIATDVFREDDTIKCPACGYSWFEAQTNHDHRNCRRYPFFPDEMGKTHAISR